MKKIGIITFHKADNYGAVLQAYALAKVCEKYGETSVLNYDNKFVDSEYYLVRPIRKKQVVKSAIKTILDLAFIVNRKKRKEVFDDFRQRYIPLSENAKTISNLSALSDNYTHLITGSDQVWSPKITDGISDEYFLNFGRKSLKRISYAPSIGNVKQLEGHEEEVNEKLSRIDSISARESDACVILSNISKREVARVVDPTILLEPNEWRRLLTESQEESKRGKYVFTYSVSYSPICAKIAKAVSRKAGLPLISSSQISWPFSNKSIFREGPIGFLRAIKNAEIVVTSSFHATVFSLIFHKELIVVPHRSTGMRVIDLLKRCNLEKNIVYSLEEYKERKTNLEIDWAKVDSALSKDREKSLIWLREALNGGKK